MSLCATAEGCGGHPCKRGGKGLVGAALRTCLSNSLVRVAFPGVAMPKPENHTRPGKARANASAQMAPCAERRGESVDGALALRSVSGKG